MGLPVADTPETTAKIVETAPIENGWLLEIYHLKTL